MALAFQCLVGKLWTPGMKMLTARGVNAVNAKATGSLTTSWSTGTLT